jgi:hypothetical protein
MTATSDTLGAQAADLICNDEPSSLGNLSRWLPFLDAPGDLPTYGRCGPRPQDVP